MYGSKEVEQPQLRLLHRRTQEEAASRKLQVGLSPLHICSVPWLWEGSIPVQGGFSPAHTIGRATNRAPGTNALHSQDEGLAAAKRRRFAIISMLELSSDLPQVFKEALLLMGPKQVTEQQQD